MTRGRISTALTNVDDAGGGRGCAKPRSPGGLFNLQPVRGAGRQMRKRKLKWDLRARGIHNLPVPFSASLPSSPTVAATDVGSALGLSSWLRDIQSGEGVATRGQRTESWRAAGKPRRPLHNPDPGRGRVRPGCQTLLALASRRWGSRGEGLSLGNKREWGMPVLKTRVWEGLWQPVRSPKWKPGLFVGAFVVTGDKNLFLGGGGGVVRHLGCRREAKS